MGKIYTDLTQFEKDNPDLFVKPDFVAVCNRLQEEYKHKRIDIVGGYSTYLKINSDPEKMYYSIPELKFTDSCFSWILKERSNNNFLTIGNPIKVDLYRFKWNDRTYYVSLEDSQQLLALITDIETWITRINTILGIR